MFIKNVSKLCLDNTYFRQVFATGKKSQLVFMAIAPGDEIGEETHAETDQWLFFLSGTGEAILGNDRTQIKAHDAVLVPAGTKHNFRNTGWQELKLFTIYAPAEHKDGLIQKTSTEAESSRT